MKKLVDPKTKQATAFYALLGIAAWDVVTRGFNRWNALALVLMAVPGAALGIAKAFGWAQGDPPPPQTPSRDQSQQK